MAIDPQHHDHGVTHGVGEVASVSSVRTPFAIAQVLCLAIGIVYVVLGAVGLARTGFDSLTREAAGVGEFRSTGLLALLHLAIGLIVLVGAADRPAARSIGLGLGPVLIAAGIIALIQPVRALGWNDANGVLYIVTGAVLLIGTMLSPPAMVRRTDIAGTRI